MCNALTVTKRESAPLPERLCERIAYCAILLTVYEADYSVVVAQSEGVDHRRHSTPEMQNILLQNAVGHIVRKAKNFAGGATDAIFSGRPVLINLMSGFVLDKTKATAEGRQWVLRQIKPECIANNAAFVAGGQIFSGIFSLLPALGNGYLYRVFLHKTGLLFLMKSSSKKHSVDALGNSLVEGWGFIPHFRLRSSRKEVSISSFCASIIFLLDTALCHGSSHHGADSGYFCSSTSPCRDVFQVYSPIFVRLCVLRNCSRWKVLTFPCSVSCAISFAICWAKKSFNLGMVRPLLTVWRSSSLGSGANGDYSGYPLALRRWSSSRATETSCSIFSASSTPIFSICSSASSEETRGFSPLPSAWRRAISPRTAVTIKFALVSPGCRDASMPLTTSCGNLAFSCCDLLLTELVDMFAPPINNGMQCNTKVNTKKDLKWYSPKCNLNTTRADTCNSAIETTKPRTVGAVTGLLTKPLTGVTIMAGTQHTQTHPKFIYTFLAVHRDCIADGKNTVHVAADTLVDACEMLNDMGYISATWKGREENTLFIQKCENNFIWRFIALSTAQPRVIHIEVTSEQEARQQSPDGCVMVFAARIRQEVEHV